MKQFRYIILSLLATISIFGAVVVSSCKNKCGSTTCQNGGTCTSNVCVCPTGYSGNACQTGWSDVAIGTYNCVRSDCKPAVEGDSTWQSAVTKDATNGGYTIDISRFDNSSITVAATIDSAINGISKITIAPSTGSAGINATGTYTNNIITLDFTSAVAGIGGFSCHIVMTKL